MYELGVRADSKDQMLAGLQKKEEESPFPRVVRKLAFLSER